MSTNKKSKWPENDQDKKNSDPGTNKERDINEDEQKKITNQQGESEEESEFYIDEAGETARKNHKRNDQNKEIENV